MLGLKEGGVDWALDENNEKLITPEMKAKVDAAKADIIAGKIKVARLHEQQLPCQTAHDAIDAAGRRAAAGDRAARHRQAFGSVHADAACRCAIATGAIHGIVGENGAGKSTLMSILYGFYQRRRGRDPGRRPAGAHATARATRSRRHRHGAPAFHAGRHLHRAGERGARRRGRRRCCAGGLGGGARASSSGSSASTGSRSIPTRWSADLSVGEQQRVEILKALFRGARILILDEPTAVLTPQETDQLFRILRDAARRAASPSS